MKTFLFAFLYPIPGAKMYRPQTVEIKADTRENAKVKFISLYPHVKITEILEKEEKENV